MTMSKTDGSPICQIKSLSKHVLINGTADGVFKVDKKDPNVQYFVRDCGCICRFTTELRKDRFRTPIRERRNHKSQSLISLNKITRQTDENRTKKEWNDVISDLKKSSKLLKPIDCNESQSSRIDEDNNLNKTTDRFENQCFIKQEITPVFYKSMFVYSFEDLNQNLYSETIVFHKKIIPHRYIETISIEIPEKYQEKSEIHIDINALDSDFKIVSNRYTETFVFNIPSDQKPKTELDSNFHAEKID